MSQGPFVAENDFAKGFSVFSELPTEVARALLPAHLEPLEVHHGAAVLSAAVFDFTAGPAGPYRELVLSIHVAPLLQPGRAVPRAALYPFQLGSTTLSACEYAVDVWHFPHWRERLIVEFKEQENAIEASVSAGGDPVIELSATLHAWSPEAQTYQSFMRDGATSYMTYVTHASDSVSEHEEEKGFLRLFDHPFHGDLPIAEVAEIPFREIWMGTGRQSFENAQVLNPPGG